MRKAHLAATIIANVVRRKLAFKKFHRLRLEKSMQQKLARFLKICLPGFRKRFHWRRTFHITKIQAAYRGHRFRKIFYNEGGYEIRWQIRNRLRLRLLLWPVWERYKMRKLSIWRTLVKFKPRTLDDWQVLIEKAKNPNRICGMVEEWTYPGFKKIFFYRHMQTGDCTLVKPKKMQMLDNEVRVFDYLFVHLSTCDICVAYPHTHTHTYLCTYLCFFLYLS